MICVRIEISYTGIYSYSIEKILTILYLYFLIIRMILKEIFPFSEVHWRVAYIAGNQFTLDIPFPPEEITSAH